MASRARSMYVSDGINILYRKVFKSQPENVSGVPYLGLAFVHIVGGKMVVQTRREFVLSFANCIPTILKEYIGDQELLASGLDLDDADMVGDEICLKICGLVFSYARFKGMKRLQVDVVFEINCDPRIAVLRALPLCDEEEEEINRMRRMRFVRKFVYGRATGGSPTAGMGAWEEEVCGICIEAMKVGEMLIRTPCIHHFHASCILPWFKRSCFCPLCRFKIEKSSLRSLF